MDFYILDKEEKLQAVISNDSAENTILYSAKVDEKLNGMYTLNLEVESVTTAISPYAGKTLISNGDFSNGIAGWVHVNAVTDGVAENTATYQHEDSYYLITNFASYRNHKLYFKADVKSSSSSVLLYLNDGVSQTGVAHSGNSQWNTLSGIRTIDSSATALLIKVQDNRASGWTKNYFDNVIAVDLTALFGAGNEPTQAWCDANLTFENTKTAVETSPSQYLIEENNVLFKDTKGNWQLYTIREVSDKHDSSKIKTVYAEHASQELIDDLCNTELVGDTAVALSVSLNSVLTGTRWLMGNIPGDAGLYKYAESTVNKSVLEVIHKIRVAYGYSVQFRFVVTGNVITARYVDLIKAGADIGKRFEYGKDIDSIERVVNTADLKTAIKITGKDGLTISDVTYSTPGNPCYKPLGQLYIENTTATAVWGRGATGSKRPRYLFVEDTSIEDAVALAQKGYDLLSAVCVPKTTYTLTVTDLYALTGDASLSHESVMLGDVVTVIDTEFVPAVTIESNIIEKQVDLLEPSNTVVTLGNYVSSLGDFNNSIQSTVDSKIKAINTFGNGSYSDIVPLNDQTFQESVGFTYIKDTEGVWVYDSPIDQNPTKMVALKGGQLAIGTWNTQTSKWDISTFIDGDSINASLINSGTLLADLIKAGILMSADGTSWINMENGTFSLADGKLVYNGTSFSLDIAGTEVETVINSKADQTALATTNTAVATAQSTANTAVTNASTAQGTANTAMTNASTAQSKANTAQSTADTAVANALTAQNTADSAVTTANTATATLADMASDSKLTAVEKQETKKEWDIIVAEKVLNDAQATTFGIVTEKTAYGTAYSTLSTYITPLLATLTTTSDVVGTTFRTNFTNYYNARTNLLNAIAVKAKSLADNASTSASNAQSTANTAVTNASNAQSTADTAVANASTAQTTANTAVANALTAQNTANTAITNASNAQTSANTANSLLTDIASDSKLTAIEKQDTKKEWDIIVAEKTGIDTQATTFGITTEKTAYDTAYDTLNTYVTPLLSNLTTTSDVVGTTFRTNFSNYYGARTTLLNAIAGKAKTLADTAKSTADSAQTTANTAVTNASTAQSTADTAKTNATTAQNTADTAVANALTAQTTADTAKANALTAQNTADTAKANALTAQNTANTAVTNASTAQTSANTANSLLTDMASDSKLTAVEKQETKKEWDVIVAEKTVNDTQATTFSITTEKTAYDTAYDTLNTYITPLLANLTTTSDIVGTTFRSNFSSYYGARTALLNAISAKAKSLADTANTNATNAQSTANTAVTNASNAQTTANTAKTTADTAVANASTAQTTANTAKTTADTAVANASTAQSTADTAILDASNAQDTADTAVTNASNAQATADTAKANALTAQNTANTAVTNASTAQTTANTASTNATSALSQLTDITSDSKVTPVEKQLLKTEWDTIQAEKTVNDTQATAFGITTEKTTYGTKYTALQTYLVTTYPLFTSLTTTTTIDSGDTMRLRFKEYYDARTGLLNAISAKAKNLADTAQTQANTATTNAQTAQNTANTAVTNASNAQADADTAQATADTAVANALTAKQTADTAVANALTAQNTADTAVANASTAQTTANTAKTYTDNLASDTKITPDEKLSLKQEWDLIVTEGTATTGKIPAQAISFGVDHSAFDTAYSTLNTYLNTTLTVFTTMTAVTTIVRATWDTNWKNYYNARTDLLNAIAVKAKSLADTAQTQANTATTNASTAQTTANTAVTNASNAQTTANTANTLAGTKKRIFTAQPTIPYDVGDTWVSIDGTGDLMVCKLARPTGVYTASDWVKGVKYTDDTTANTAVTTANTAIANASTAQTTANTASTNASSALTQLTDISADNKVTAVEKQILKTEWDTIVAEKTVNDAQADTFGITTEKTTYGTKYTALQTYIVTTYPLFTNLATTTTIDSGDTLRLKFKEYYDARTGLLNAIAVKAKNLADTAKSTADTAVANASTAQTTANTAVTNASNAQTTANTANTLAGSKRRVFTAQPTSPYDVGDVWVSTNGTGDLMVCKTARASGAYLASEWTKAVKYTDDTLATTANTNAGNAQTTANTANSTANTLRDTTVPALTTRVSTAEANILTQADQIALKVSQTDVDVSINALQDYTDASVATASATANTALNGANTANSQLLSKADKTALDNLVTTVTDNYSALTQRADGVDIEVSSVQTRVSATETDMTAVKTYFDFGVNGMTIGQDSSPLKINMSNTEMDFLDNGTVVAYINGQKMYITSAEILSSLEIGVHKIEKYNSDISIVRWVG